MKKIYILLAIVIFSLGSFYAKQTLGREKAPHQLPIEKNKEWRKSYELERTSPAQEEPQMLSPLPLAQPSDSIVFIPRGVGKHFTSNEDNEGYDSGRASGCSGRKYWV
ncbi:hypothetical protein [Lewinella sp. LCG006]|uniref:hypothetical protein n=1 Tax=Lewinella sp. LCG006 TaxID=3231911 RepID=UPI003460ACC9